MLTPRGPRLIEIAARPGGGEHQRCSEIATGDSQIRRTVAHRARGAFTPGYELVKHLRNVLISAPRAGIWHNAEIFDGVDALRSYHSKHVPYRSGDHVPATRDVLTILAWVVLASPDREAVDADYRQVKAWEDRLDIRPLADSPARPEPVRSARVR
jgi:glutathione S-transferase